MSNTRRKDSRKIKDKRSFFIADRVVASQFILLFLTGIITWLIHKPGMSHVEIENTLITWGILALCGTIAALIIIEYFREYLYFRWHWLVTFVMLSFIWLPLTVFAGLLIDVYVAARGNVLVVSLLIMVNLIIGYFIAGMLRLLRFKVSKAVLITLSIVISAVIMLITGMITAETGIIHVLLTGIGTVISLFVNYYMLFALYEIEGSDVIEDPPNKLYYVCLRNSIILTMIMWVLMATLFPPIPAGSGGSKRKKRGSSSSRSSKSSKKMSRRRRYGRRRRYSMRTYKGFPFDREEVEEEWKEYKLGRDDVD